MKWQLIKAFLFPLRPGRRVKSDGPDGLVRGTVTKVTDGPIGRFGVQWDDYKKGTTCFHNQFSYGRTIFPTFK